MMVVQNADKIPHYFDNQQPGEEHDVVYHGTYPECIPNIALNGFKPGAGAGSAAVGERYFNEATYEKCTFPVHVPGLYVSTDFHTAAQYPMESTAMRKDAYAGSLLARRHVPHARHCPRLGSQM